MFNMLEIGGPAGNVPDAPPLDSDTTNYLPSTTARKDVAALSGGTLVEPMSQAQRSALVWLGVAGIALLVWLYPSTAGGE